MKTKIILLGLVSSIFLIAMPGCKDDKDTEGCTDPNAHNYDSKADKNTDCRYRYASNIDISGVPTSKPAGGGWDDSDGPDLKLNFGKASSSGYDHTTNTADDANTSATSTLTPNGDIKFTNEQWKFELVDVDLIGSETIATGTFNPLKDVSNNMVTVEANGVTFKFKFTIK
jgi:hypothetical protein